VPPAPPTVTDFVFRFDGPAVTTLPNPKVPAPPVMPVPERRPRTDYRRCRCCRLTSLPGRMVTAPLSVVAKLPAGVRDRAVPN